MIFQLACQAPATHSAGETAANDTEDSAADTAGDSTETASDSADTTAESGDSGVDSGETGNDEPAACGEAASPRRWCSSCAELLAALPGTPSGPATLEAAGVELDAWCEMSTAGGGWTLAGTNAWGGAWTETSVLDDSQFGVAGLDADYAGPAFVDLPFRDLYFETADEYAVYLDVGDGIGSYKRFQDGVPLHNCGIDTPYEWHMSEGTLSDKKLCSTNLYVSPKDWEGGEHPCGDSESAYGPAWSGDNKGQGCPLNDPYGTSFISDAWDYSMWGDHDPKVVNATLRMWVR